MAEVLCNSSGVPLRTTYSANVNLNAKVLDFVKSGGPGRDLNKRGAPRRGEPQPLRLTLYSDTAQGYE